MNKTLRLFSLMFVDGVLVFLSYFFALLLRFDFTINEKYFNNLLTVSILFVFTGILSFYVVGLYNRVWRYASIGELLGILSGVLIASGLQLVLTYFFVETNEAFLPRSVFLMALVFQVMFIGGSRFFWRVLLNFRIKPNSHRGKKMLIIGAGDAGSMIAKEMNNHFGENVDIVGFIDDNPLKQGQKIYGIPVLGGRDDIQRLTEELTVEKIVIAIPSAKAKDIRHVIEICRNTDAELKILPGMYDIISGKVDVKKIREVRVEDLLGRDPVNLDIDSMAGFINGRRILVTGAGGSIGSELVRQICRFRPQQLLILDIHENSLYDISNEIKVRYPEANLVELVKNIREGYALRDVFERYKPEVVFHAAAHKHVPLMECNGEEAVKNNIRGTYNLLKYASQYDVSRVVVISTDKAVNPTNIMGASKRVTEHLVQYFNSISKTEYAAVRFGNVLGSQGSVIPLFKKQIEAGGPVTVTDPEIIRYFMTIPEAVQLVIQAGSMAKGGEIFVLDMGEPVRILDLAESLIKLSGYVPYKDIEIVYTGLRPGEKLFEELLCSMDRCDTTRHERIFIERLVLEDKGKVEALIKQIETNNLPLDRDNIIKLLKNLVPEYTPYDLKENKI